LSCVSAAQSLVERQFVEYKQHRYLIQWPGGTAADKTVADDSDDAAERCVLMRDVPAELTDAVPSLLSEHVRDMNAQLDDKQRLEGMLVFCLSL